ncbi:hypothetical protein OG417_48140 [Actinoallomurus sp. NBC_01490]|jgi:hypothetical protein|uniref:hypothetical protein n=1 Tax=Actinoallomurus sp. NBC_01490 TaxID=2903557 RepID=UPI002E342492|nr:hypothetical protein [Actinoallomurus sp. NBC_01490]
MRKHLWKSCGDGGDVSKRQRRAPSPWWWVRIIISSLLMIWRTVIWVLTWHDH